MEVCATRRSLKRRLKPAATGVRFNSKSLHVLSWAAFQILLLIMRQVRLRKREPPLVQEQFWSLQVI